MRDAAAAAMEEASKLAEDGQLEESQKKVYPLREARHKSTSAAQITLLRHPSN